MNSLNSLRFVLHDDAGINPTELLDMIGRCDQLALIKRKWKNVLAHLDETSYTTPDVIVDVIGRNPSTSIIRLNDLWEGRCRHNYSPVPIYFAVSRVTQPTSVRYKIRRLGGHFIYLFEQISYFEAELQLIQMELAELKLSLPRWRIVEEGLEANRQAHIFFVYRGEVEVSGSPAYRAALAVWLKHNGIVRSRRQLQILCANDPLFVPSGGGFAVPSLGTIKAYLCRYSPLHLQLVFDKNRSGFSATDVVHREKLDLKTMGYKIRGVLV